MVVVTCEVLGQLVAGEVVAGDNTGDGVGPLENCEVP